MTEKPPVQIDIGAKAEAKFEVKAEIPPHSVGRFVDAVTDIFRPFSESRGLKADQIRLQRAEVAIEIARLARRAIEEEGLEVHPIANKVLVPLIEKASYEDLSDEFMVKRWADLLVSASQEDTVPPLYVQILSEIDGRQAQSLFDLMMNEYKDWYRSYTVFADSFLELDAGQSAGWIQKKFSARAFKSRVEFYKVLVDYLCRPGCYFYYVGEPDIDAEGYLRDFGVQFHSGLERDLEICCATGLLKREELVIHYKAGKKNHSAEVIYFRLTGIGVEFLESCARDAVKELKLHNARTKVAYEANAGHKNRIGPTRINVRSQRSNSVIGISDS